MTSRREKLERYLPPTIAAAAIALAAFLLHRALRDTSPEELLASALAVPPHRLALAAAFAAASYLCLTAFDALAVRYAGHRLPYRKTALASFVALSLGHTIGFAALSSGAIRYRFYTRWGLKAGDVAKVIVFCGVTVALGLALLGGIAFIAAPQIGTVFLGGSRLLAVSVGAFCLAGVTAYMVAALVWTRPLLLRGWRFEMPSFRLAVGQVAVGALNFSLVAAALYNVVAAAAESSYPEVAAVYVVANSATLISHVPGGVGVIEGTVLYLLPASGLLGAVLLFRLIYFIAPLAVGICTFTVTELLLARQPARRRETA